MKWSILILFVVAFVGVFVLVQHDNITGGSATDTATLTITFKELPPVDNSPPSSGGGGGGGGSGSNSQNSVAPATYGQSANNAKTAPAKNKVKNYYESESLKFAPTSTAAMPLRTSTETGKISARTKIFSLGLALIIISLLIALLLTHSHKPKKHTFKRNKV